MMRSLSVAARSLSNMADYLERHGFDSVTDLVGTLQT